MFTIFIIKFEVAGTMMMTQCLSSCDPIEKSSIFHSYVSVSSSEDAGVGHSGDIHWVPSMALVLWPGTECLCDVCERSHEGLHLPWLSVPGTCYEPILPSTPTYGELTSDHIRTYFQPPRYPTDRESNSDTRLIPTVSLDSDLLEPSYPSYHVESDPSEPSRPLVIHLTSDSSSSSSSKAPHHAPPPIHGRGFIRTHTVPRGCVCARGGGCGDDAPGGFGNGYLPFDGWLGQCMRSRARE